MDQAYSAWSPLRVERGDGKFSVHIWGRTYVFDHSLLPTEIHTAGRQILSAPASAELTFGSVAGTLREHRYLFRRQSEEEATVLVSATCENLAVDEVLTFSFDGFVKISLTLVPFWSFSPNGESAPRLTGLRLRFPLKAESSTLFHYWPNDTTSIIPSQKVMNSGACRDADFPFKPFLLCGWEAGGLTLCCESDTGFQLRDPRRCISVRRNDGETELLIRVLEEMPEDWRGRRDDWCETLKPRTYTFGLQATPVKAMPKDYPWDRFVWSTGKVEDREADLDRAIRSGGKWIILHEHWSAIQNYGMPEDEDALRDYIRRCHEAGVRVMAYFGYEFSTLSEEWPEKADSYLIKTPSGNYTGGWQRQPWQRDFMVCYAGDYSGRMLERVAHGMDDYGLDGVYTDGTFVPWECANETHGCGRRDASGRLHTTFPIFAVREHVKKLYAVVHRRGGRIDTHQSSCCFTPALAFCDSYFDGENIQGAVNADPAFLDLAAFRCEYAGRNLGIPAVFLTYIGMEKVSGLTVLHNVLPRADRGKDADLDYVSRLWDIFDAYRLRESPWHPYYEPDCPVLARDPRVTVSAWRPEGCLIAAVATLRLDVCHAVITAPEPYRQAEDLLTGERFPRDDSGFPMPLTPRTLRLLRFTT